MSAPHLVKMSREIFEGIPAKAVPRTTRLEDPTFESPGALEFILAAYCRKFLEDNKGIEPLLGTEQGRSALTPGQRVLYVLGALDGQVRNGGIAQFFWNCPDLIFETSDALKHLGMTELHELYERALENLVGKQETWGELRKQWVQAEGDPPWAAFEESYEVLDVNWFDDAYFATHGNLLVKRLVEFVRTHTEEFFES